MTISCSSVAWLATDAGDDAREPQRLHGEVACEEDLTGDLVVLPRAFEAGEPEGELAALCDVETDEGVIALRAEVEPPEGLVGSVVATQVGVVHAVRAGAVLAHRDRGLVELHARPVDLGLRGVDDLVRQEVLRD